jgi:hypothetical protein
MCHVVYYIGRCVSMWYVSAILYSRVDGFIGVYSVWLGGCFLGLILWVLSPYFCVWFLDNFVVIFLGNFVGIK